MTPDEVNRKRSFSVAQSPAYLRLWRRKAHRALRDPHRLGLIGMAAAISLVLTLDAFLLSCGFKGCPTVAAIEAFQPTEGGKVYDRKGVQLGQMVAVRRDNVPLDSVPRHVRDAFLVTEDRRFYEHHGIDGRAMVRAITRNITSLSFAEGYSTITMQLARNSFIPGGRSGNPLARKLLEMRVARLLERNLSKDEIFALYLNAIYMGGGVYGVEGASRDLFGKSVSKVTVAEGALLAALPKAPSYYNPRADAGRAKTRRDLVLSLMAQAGVIDSTLHRRSRSSPVKVAATVWDDGRFEPSALSPIRTFVDSVMRSLGREGEEVLVHTTIDAIAQKSADSAVARRARIIQRESDAYYRGKKGDIQGAMVAIDPTNGGILALVGSARYERGGFNRAFNARRQPGSAFKPFVYAAALKRGLTPATLVPDEPVVIRDVGAGKYWTPANYGGEYFGILTMRNALAKSANAATIGISRQVGEGNIVKLARDNGINSPLAPVPAIALGALEVTPLELVAAYAPFANGGFRITPTLVSRIESRHGELLWAAGGEKVPVLDERDAFLVTSMLRSVVDEGTGTAIRAYGVHGVVAGKTGTTNEAADVWFVGYTPTIVAGFWFGYDTPRMISGGANGGRHAAPAWAEFYRGGWRDRDIWRGWPVPRGIVQRTIDEETGHLAGDWCPMVRDEYFKVGTEPQEYCTGHSASFGGWIDRLGRSVGDLFRRGGRVDTMERRGGRRRGGGH